MKKKIYIEAIFIFILGALTSLSLPPFNYVLINFFTMSLLFVFLVKKFENYKNKKISFFFGWLFGFGYFATNLYWLSISLTFDESFTFLIPFSIILVPGFLALFYGLSICMFIILKPKKILSSFFLFSLIFGLVEYLRGTILTGFPWNLFAYSFSNHLEIINVISIIGTYGFNLFCISLFTSPAMLIFREEKKNIFVFFIFFVITTSLYFYGSSNLNKFDESEFSKHGYKIRIVSSDISIDRFYNNIDPTSVIKDLIQISLPQKNEKMIFIWPEGILPGISQNQLIEYKWLFKEKFNKNHLLIMGINNEFDDNEAKKYFNSLAIYDHNLNLVESYNKINLVPFGEFLPFEKLFRMIGLKTVTNNYQSFSNGNERNIIDLSKNNFSLKILPLICYEIIYTGKISKDYNFDFIINISEDGWFGESVGPKQHFVHSIYRAIESGKYVLRSTNNGITAIINPLGVVEKKLSLNEAGYIDFIGSRKFNPTFFSKYGNKIFVLIILLYIFLFFSFKKLKNE